MHAHFLEIRTPKILWKHSFSGSKLFTLSTVCCTEFKVWTIFVINTLRPRQNGRHFADDIFKCIFLNENVLISIKISLKFVPKGQINNIPALVNIMAWRHPGDKPLSEPMMSSLPTRICVTRPQWVNVSYHHLAVSIGFPWDTWRNNNVISTSQRRCDIILT